MSAAQKHERETVRAVKALHPQIRADVQTRRGNTHKWLVATLGEHTVRHSVASSPSNPDSMVEVVARAIRRKFAQLGVTL